MIHCSECGKPLEKVPSWLANVKIRFVCDNCRQVNPQHWLPAIGEEEEEKVVAVDGEEVAFVEGEVSLEELAEEDRKRLMGEDLFDSDTYEEPE